MSQAERIEGLIAAPFTPMTESGEVNAGLIDRYAAMLRDNGVCGVFVCGSTGEGPSLTVSERLGLAEAWRAASGGLRVLINVAGECLPACRQIAAHAQKIGADGIGAFGPTYFKPATVGALVDWCEALAAAAPELPFYFYHIPSMTGLSFPMAEFLPAAERRIPNLAGAKFTFENLEDFQRCLGLSGGRFDMLFGRDEILLAALALGARGAIGSTYNFAAPLYLGIIDAFRRGDLRRAREAQSDAARMIALLRRWGGMAAFKAVMGLIGLDCGPPRLPLRALDAGRRDSMRTELAEIGFFDYCSKVRS